jgi:ATP-dependent Zn protease
MSTRKERIIAYHEAGHAVVARVLGLGVVHVAMFPTDGDGLAGAQTWSAAWLARDADHSTKLRALENDAKVNLAGPQAQAHYRPQDAKRIRPEWRDDYKLATSSIVKAVLLKADPSFDTSLSRSIDINEGQSKEVARAFDQIISEVQALVADYWAAIERTADELLLRRIISGDEVDAIIRETQ